MVDFAYTFIKFATIMNQSRHFSLLNKRVCWLSCVFKLKVKILTIVNVITNYYIFISKV